jgi:hypothetical protein
VPVSVGPAGVVVLAPVASSVQGVPGPGVPSKPTVGRRQVGSKTTTAPVGAGTGLGTTAVVGPVVGVGGALTSLPPAPKPTAAKGS